MTTTDSEKTMPLKERKIYPKWEIEVSETGKVIFKDQDKFDEHLIPYRGKGPMHLTVKHISKSRSRQEEKFYHAVVVRMVAEAMDIPDQEAHELLKGMFLTVEEKSIAGYRYTRVMSTTELTDKAYREYWGKCIQWAALPTESDGLGETSGLSLYVPMPNEVDYQDA